MGAAEPHEVPTRAGLASLSKESASDPQEELSQWQLSNTSVKQVHQQCRIPAATCVLTTVEMYMWCK